MTSEFIVFVNFKLYFDFKLRNLRTFFSLFWLTPEHLILLELLWKEFLVYEGYQLTVDVMNLVLAEK